MGDARREAAAAGVNGRVRFAEADAEGVAEEGPYDLVCVLEALHDMARPAEALAAARAALAPGGGGAGGRRAGGRALRGPGRPGRAGDVRLERHPLPAQLARGGGLGGARHRAARRLVRELAAAAGFATPRSSPVENDFFRLYWLAG